jgi:hypothetical protein
MAAAPERWYGGEAQHYGLVAPRDAAVLFERMNNAVRARRGYERLVAQWATGDTDLVSVRDARARLIRLRGASGALQPERR